MFLYQVFVLCRDPDITMCMSSNEAYHTVGQAGGATGDYKIVSDQQPVPPLTSSQPTTAWRL